MPEFKHFISLGYFCGVASTLETLGLRSASYPVDWCLSEFPELLCLIENGFQHYLSYDDMAQSKKIRSRYINAYGVIFVHDFTRFLPLSDQIDSVKEKYERRIRRFYRDIREPTLFLRFLKDEKELSFIEENKDRIQKLLKSFHPDNEILYIANSSYRSETVDFYPVDGDENGHIHIGNFIEKNEELSEYLENVYYPERQKNIERLKNKKKRRRYPFPRKTLFRFLIGKLSGKEYIHSKEF